MKIYQQKTPLSIYDVKKIEVGDIIIYANAAIFIIKILSYNACFNSIFVYSQEFKKYEIFSDLSMLHNFLSLHENS